MVIPLRCPRIHVFGASGSGSTTLGRAVASAVRIPHFDSDDFYWEPTDPPFRHKREPAERVRLLGASLDGAGSSWVLTGSLCGWGDPLIGHFDLVVFLSLSAETRLERLRARELQRYGAERLAAHGDMAASYTEFMAWAARYDEAGPEQRSRAVHESWISTLSCTVLRLDSNLPVTHLCTAVLRAAL